MSQISATAVNLCTVLRLSNSKENVVDCSTSAIKAMISTALKDDTRIEHIEVNENEDPRYGPAIYIRFTEAGYCRCAKFAMDDLAAIQSVFKSVPTRVLLREIPDWKSAAQARATDHFIALHKVQQSTTSEDLCKIVNTTQEQVKILCRNRKLGSALLQLSSAVTTEALEFLRKNLKDKAIETTIVGGCRKVALFGATKKRSEEADGGERCLMAIRKFMEFDNFFGKYVPILDAYVDNEWPCVIVSFGCFMSLAELHRRIRNHITVEFQTGNGTERKISCIATPYYDEIEFLVPDQPAADGRSFTSICEQIEAELPLERTTVERLLGLAFTKQQFCVMFTKLVSEIDKFCGILGVNMYYGTQNQGNPLQLTFVVDICRVGQRLPTDLSTSSTSAVVTQRAVERLFVSLEDKLYLMTVHFCKVVLNYYQTLQRESMSCTIMQPSVAIRCDTTSNAGAAFKQEQSVQDLLDFTPHEILWLKEVGELNRVCSKNHATLKTGVDGGLKLHCTPDIAQRIKESLFCALYKHKFGGVNFDVNDAVFNSKLQNEACRALLQEKWKKTAIYDMPWVDTHGYEEFHSVLMCKVLEQLGSEATQLVLWHVLELERKVTLFSRADTSIAERFARTILDRISCTFVEVQEANRKLLATKRWKRICSKLEQDAFVCLRPSGQQIAVAAFASADSKDSSEKALQRVVLKIKDFFECCCISNESFQLEPVMYTFMSLNQNFRRNFQELNNSYQKEAEKAGLDSIVIQDVKQQTVTNACIALHCGLVLSGSKLLVDPCKQKLLDIAKNAERCKRQQLQFIDKNGQEINARIVMRFLRSSEVARQIMEEESVINQCALIYSLDDTISGTVCAVDQLQFNRSEIASDLSFDERVPGLVPKAAYTTMFGGHIFEVHVGIETSRQPPCDLHIYVVCNAEKFPDLSCTIDKDRLCIISEGVLCVAQDAVAFELRKAVSDLMRHCIDDYCVNVTLKGRLESLQGVNALVVERVLKAYGAQDVRGTIRFLADNDTVAAGIIRTLQHVNTVLLRWSSRVPNLSNASSGATENTANTTKTNEMCFSAEIKKGLRVSFTIGDVVDEQADALVFGLLQHSQAELLSNRAGVLYSTILGALKDDASRFQLELKLTEMNAHRSSNANHSTAFCSSGGSLKYDVLVAVRFAYHTTAIMSKHALNQILEELLCEVFRKPNLRRVAFSMLGTGIHGWKAEQAAEAFAEALITFSAKFPTLRDLHVMIVGLRDAADSRQYEMTLRSKLLAHGASVTNDVATVGTPSLRAASHSERPKLLVKKPKRQSSVHRINPKLLLVGLVAEVVDRVELELQNLVRTSLCQENKNLGDDCAPPARRVLNELEWMKSVSIEVTSSNKGNHSDRTVLSIAGVKNCVLDCFVSLENHIVLRCEELSKALAIFQHVQWRVLLSKLPSSAYDSESFDVFNNHEIEMRRRERSIKGETPKPINMQRFCTKLNRRLDVTVDVSELIELSSDQTTKRALSRCAVVAADDQLDADGLPLLWDPMRAEETLKIVNVDRKSEEFSSVSKRIKSSLLHIVLSIERIQNRKLYKQFRAECDEFSKRFKGTAEGKPKLLYHGTKEDHKDSIAKEGLDRSRAGLNVGAVYGKGVYFSNDFKTSAQTCYAIPNAAGEQHMFFCDVLVGKCVVGNQLMLILPESYDTAVDKLNDPTIFVKFRDAPIYPKYFVKFKPLGK